jgi:hypothetical protein
MRQVLILLGVAGMFFLASCQKELSDNFTPYQNNPLNDTIWPRSIPSTAAVYELAQLLAPDIYVDSIDLAKDSVVEYGDSLRVVVPTGSCISATGAPVTSGKARVEIFRIRRKGDYIKLFKPTTSNGNLLESASAFYMRILKDGKELILAPGFSIKIRFTDSEEPKTNMQVFNGHESNPPFPFAIIDTAFNWVRDADTSWIKIIQKQGSGGISIKQYEMAIRNLRWTAAERYADSSKTKTKITAILPLNFTSKNTAVFAVFADQRTVVSMPADYASRSFAVGRIPIGTKLKLVSVSRIGDDLYLGTRDVNDVGSIVAYSFTPEKKSLKDILIFLNSL